MIMEKVGMIKVASHPLKKLMTVIQTGLGNHNEDTEIRKENYLNDSDSQSDNRIQQRIDYREKKRQQNLDYINYIAAEQLDQKSEVSEDPVDEDWTTRFFNYAQDISEAEMQILWGRIIAGEIMRPKSYSLRTLDILRNLSKEEAQIFMKFASLCIKTENGCFALNFNNENLLEEKYGLTFDDRLLLEELGLITANDLEFRVAKTDGHPSQVVYIIGSVCVIQEKIENKGEQKLPVLVFTKIGQQLLQLVDFTPDLDYIQLLSTKLNRDNGPIRYGHILEYLPDGRIKHTPLIEVPLTEFEVEQKRKQKEQEKNK